jgi:glycosyltransferase involved in cell wall biosynthesis
VRTPVITTLRGTDVSRSADSFAMRLLLKSCFRLSRCLVAVGPGIRDDASRILGTDPDLIQVVPNGVDAGLFALPLPRPGAPLRLITVGSLVEVKDVRTILRALSLLPPDLRWELTLVGDGPQRPSLECLGRDLGISSSLRFVGAVPPRQVSDHLSRSQVFVLASRSEGRPNAMVEALAAGRTVVASRIPAHAELVTDARNGLLFERGNASELAACLHRLSRDSGLLTALGKRGRESVAGLSWEAAGESYASLYRRLAMADGRRCAV